jgi:DNA recombination protein RmuC
MISTPILILIIVAAAAVGWLAASALFRKRYADQIVDAQKQMSGSEGKVSALQAMNEQLRADTDKMSAKADEDFKALRTVLSSEQAARVKAETELKEASQRLAEERALIEDAQKKLSDTFQALAATSLNQNNEAFIKLARATFENVLSDAKGDLGAKEEAIKGLITPIADSLKLFGEHVRTLETTRLQAYTGLEEHLKSLTASQQQLQRETGNLVTALRTPHVRGRWGEMTLRRVVELAEMSEHCDFTEQVTFEGEEGRLRPDLIVHLPSDRNIVIDAKVSLDAYLSATTAATDEEREAFLVTHARQVRAHMTKLGGKAYFEQLQPAPEFVVMFIPGESFFAEAAHHDLKLIEDGMQNRVIPASPTTLITLLLAVAFGWRQEQIAKNAQAISDLGKKMHERMRILVEHISEIGRGLEKATGSYNKAVGSMEKGILPAARQFKELGATTGDEIQVLPSLDFIPRALNVPEGFGDANQP